MEKQSVLVKFDIIGGFVKVKVNEEKKCEENKMSFVVERSLLNSSKTQYDINSADVMFVLKPEEKSEVIKWITRTRELEPCPKTIINLAMKISAAVV